MSTDELTETQGPGNLPFPLNLQPNSGGSAPALISPAWLKSLTKNELADLALEIMLELRSRIEESTTTVNIPTNVAPHAFPAVPDAEITTFVRMPVVSDKTPAEARATTWRIVLFPFGTSHPPLGLEIYDDITIGRQVEDVDLNLAAYDADEHGVSRHHAMLHPTENGLLLVDLGSSNGTFLNHQRIAVGTPFGIDDEDVITFGALHFKMKVISRPSVIAR